GNGVAGIPVALASTLNGSILVQPGPTGADGVATGTLASNTAGQATVSATVNGAALGQQAIVTFAPNLFAPKPAADAYSTPKNVALAVSSANGLLANDNLGMPSGALVSFGGGGLGGSVTTNAPGSTAAIGGGGSLMIGADGSVAFTPVLGFSGVFTTF